MRIFLAGGTGVLGRRLVPQLVAAGHDVVATTRHADRQTELEAMGARPAVMDALDGRSVDTAVMQARPEVVIHQLTSIAGSDLRHFDRTFAATNRLRTTGTDRLLAAAQAAGVRRFVAQSFTGWPNERTGGPVKTEDDPLTDDPPTRQRRTLAAIKYLEQAVTAAPMESVVLRYGLFYGASAWADVVDLLRARKFPVVGDGNGVWSLTHVDDAAAATVAAVTRGSGIYNIVDDEPAAIRDMLPALADIVGAEPPRRVPVWVGRLLAGEVPVSMLTQSRGSSNAKAKRELGWQPRWASWRDGMRHEVLAGAGSTP